MYPQFFILHGVQSEGQGAATGAGPTLLLGEAIVVSSKSRYTLVPSMEWGKEWTVAAGSCALQPRKRREAFGFFCKSDWILDEHP